MEAHCITQSASHSQEWILISQFGGKPRCWWSFTHLWFNPFRLYYYDILSLYAVGQHSYNL